MSFFGVKIRPPEGFTAKKTFCGLWKWALASILPFLRMSLCSSFIIELDMRDLLLEEAISPFSQLSQGFVCPLYFFSLICSLTFLTQTNCVCSSITRKNSTQPEKYKTRLVNFTLTFKSGLVPQFQNIFLNIHGTTYNFLQAKEPSRGSYRHLDLTSRRVHKPWVCKQWKTLALGTKMGNISTNSLNEFLSPKSSAILPHESTINSHRFCPRWAWQEKTGPQWGELGEELTLID